MGGGKKGEEDGAVVGQTTAAATCPNWEIGEEQKHNEGRRTGNFNDNVHTTGDNLETQTTAMA